MTPERAKELLPVIQAFAEGKTIEWNVNSGGGDLPTAWTDCHAPNWADKLGYRIKPHPKFYHVGCLSRPQTPPKIERK
jgi:hypothetical protein